LAQRARQLRFAIRARGEHGTRLEPTLYVEALPLAAPREPVHHSGAGHEQRRRDIDPKQRHHGQPQHLPEREQSVLQCRQQIHRRLHSECSTPSSAAPAASPNAQAADPTAGGASGAARSASADSHPDTMAGDTASITASTPTSTNASSRSATVAKRGRSAASPLDAAASPTTSTYAAGGGSPCADRTDTHTAAVMPPHRSAAQPKRGLASAIHAPAGARAPAHTGAGARDGPITTDAPMSPAQNMIALRARPGSTAANATTASPQTIPRTCNSMKTDRLPRQKRSRTPPYSDLPGV